MDFVCAKSKREKLMKNSRFVLFILIVSLAACLAVTFSACDLDDVSDEDLLVAGQEDLSMYETKIPDYSGGNLYLVKIKDEFKNKIKTAIIPSEIYAVGWNAFEGCENLETVIVKEGVNSIGNGAFKNCGKLANVELPEGFSEIYPNTFMNCISLEEISLPDSVKRINENAFFNCIKLKNIKMSKNILVKENAFYNTAFYNTVDDGMIYINTLAYKYVGDMPKNTTYKLREGTTGIAGGAFDNIDGLRHLVLPDSCEYLSSASIRDCKNLLSLTIGKNYKGENVYCGGWFEHVPAIIRAYRLVEVYNKSDVDIQEDYSFGALNLKSVWLMNVYRENEQSALDIRDDGQVYMQLGDEKILVEYSTDSTQAAVESGTTIIRKHAFYDSENLKKVVIPEGVREIESEAFVDCEDLSTFELPVSLKKIGYMVFFGNNVNVSSYQIYYNGTVEQWKAIENHMNYEYVAQCTDGVVKYDKTA